MSARTSGSYGSTTPPQRPSRRARACASPGRSAPAPVSAAACTPSAAQPVESAVRMVPRRATPAGYPGAGSSALLVGALATRAAQPPRAAMGGWAAAGREAAELLSRIQRDGVGGCLIMRPVRRGRSRRVCRAHHPGWDRSCESFGPGEAAWRAEAECPIVLGGGEGMAGQFSCTALEGKAYVAGPFGLLSFSPEEGWATLPASPTAGGCPVVAVAQHAGESGLVVAPQRGSPASTRTDAGPPGAGLLCALERRARLARIAMSGRGATIGARRRLSSRSRNIPQTQALPLP